MVTKIAADMSHSQKTDHGHENIALDVLEDPTESENSFRSKYTTSGSHLAPPDIRIPSANSDDQDIDEDSDSASIEKSFVDDFKKPLTVKPKLGLNIGSSLMRTMTTSERPDQDYPDHYIVDMILVSK